MEHVINFDLPFSKDEFDSYVRRIGRTGGDTLFGKSIENLRAAHTRFFREWMES